MSKSLIAVLAIVLLAASGTAYAESKAPSTKSKTVSAETIACIRKAVDVRETALSDGRSKLSTNLDAAYEARAYNLDLAYANASSTAKDIKAKVKDVWSSFKSTVKEARGTWKSTQKEAWATFKNSAAACKGTMEMLDSPNASADAAV